MYELISVFGTRKFSGCFEIQYLFEYNTQRVNNITNY